MKQTQPPRKGQGNWFPSKSMRRGVQIAKERAQRHGRHTFIASSVRQAEEQARREWAKARRARGSR